MTTTNAAEGRNDQEALASLDKKLLLVDDCVTAVVGHYETGLYLYGSGGLGKSYTVMKKLEELGASVKVFNSRMTPKGLFLALEKAPDAVHVLEDMERLTDDRDAQGVLRSALWSQPDKPRQVTWTTATGGEHRFEFRGGIIMLANRPLHDLPELRALATRISVHKLEISEAEMTAQLRRIAGEGFGRGKHQLDAEKSLQVAEFVIAECKAAGCPLDIRLFDHSCLDFLQWDANNSACNWKDRVTNRINQTVLHFRHAVVTMSKEERMDSERETVHRICAQTQDGEEQVKLWKERTGKSRATFHRRKQELGHPDFAV
jgi:hypothetical protein